MLLVLFRKNWGCSWMWTLFSMCLVALWIELEIKLTIHFYYVMIHLYLIHRLCYVFKCWGIIFKMKVNNEVLLPLNFLSFKTSLLDYWRRLLQKKSRYLKNKTKIVLNLTFNTKEKWASFKTQMSPYAFQPKIGTMFAHSLRWTNVELND